ncbi:MAG: radical SAM protein [Bdellovibrionota bacterium]
MNQKSAIGFYFHIPFCPHICPYCDFAKTSHFQKKDIDTYFAELLNQLEYFLSLLNCTKDKKTYATAYFGGGTPGLFKSKFYLPLLNKLREYYILEEVTLETNPYTNYEKNFLDYKNAGFNRLTLGAQSLCPNTLKTLGRKHTATDILKNLDWAKKSGFAEIQVDLIYGLKKEIRTLCVDEEIQTLYNAGATGISAYFLTLEKRTLFANSDLVDEDNGVEEYLKIINKCKDLGLKQIETSNFSQFEAKHNNLYWYGLPYVGIGTGAHGLLPPSTENPYGIRYKIGENIQTSSPGNDILIYSEEEQCKNNFRLIYEKPRTKQEYLEESIFTLLRTPNGLSFDWLISVTNDNNIVQKLLKNAKFQRAINEGKILCTKTNLFLSAEEKIRGDAWALEFISAIL